MKTTSVIALSLLLGLFSINVSHAQSEEDPLGDFESFFSELESFESESSGELGELSDEAPDENVGEAEGPVITEDLTEPQAESADNLEEFLSSATENETTATESITTQAEPVVSNTPSRGNLSSARLSNAAAPEGKENHVLYNIPGAIEHNGMTFINIDSRKFFNRYQKCDIAETDTITSSLSRLKLSQGAPLACREDMKYKFLPYKNFRTTR